MPNIGRITMIGAGLLAGAVLAGTPVQAAPPHRAGVVEKRESFWNFNSCMRAIREHVRNGDFAHATCEEFQDDSGRTRFLLVPQAAPPADTQGGNQGGGNQGGGNQGGPWDGSQGGGDQDWGGQEPPGRRG
ncbi:hypothetical protein [Actinoplanes sp. L3-i22]|uniref:hypothetical protein n=1 Tax=Actinoplanes sp. L3-i22 TaxID=2836373 RepID=UPI001C78A8BA|nr:hypothetical protein [Actinoplanes sp. L3-i22]BCY12863.1 hypothetical protein L3i22_079510 [Actinoplanes sp. L3-i22]